MDLETAKAIISDTYGKYRISTDSINPELMEEFAKTLKQEVNKAIDKVEREQGVIP